MRFCKKKNRHSFHLTCSRPWMIVVTMLMALHCIDGILWFSLRPPLGLCGCVALYREGGTPARLITQHTMMCQDIYVQWQIYAETDGLLLRSPLFFHCNSMCIKAMHSNKMRTGQWKTPAINHPRSKQKNEKQPKPEVTIKRHEIVHAGDLDWVSLLNNTYAHLMYSSSAVP